jgi:predicted P-loop ATPase
VVTYLGCEDSELNRAIGRKVLIAAARRARRPGCKFDNITVLEGSEGRKKSTVIRLLAGDENFSDQRVLGLSDKEVQEQLAGVWMHENADLAGMTRAEVEHVKAFASRQVDRARPAYGRVREDRKRRSIEWGTTNNKEYLLSQTGNRRFWPLEIGTIDIEALKRDRLQLLGEAATYEVKGEDIFFNERLEGLAREAQEGRRTKDPWEDVLAEIPPTITIFGSSEEGESGGEGEIIIIHRIAGEERVSSRDLLEYILKIPPARQSRFDAMRLAEVMKAVGWNRNTGGKVTIENKQVRGYWRLAAQMATEEKKQVAWQPGREAPRKLGERRNKLRVFLLGETSRAILVSLLPWDKRRSDWFPTSQIVIEPGQDDFGRIEIDVPAWLLDRAKDKLGRTESATAEEIAEARAWM